MLVDKDHLIVEHHFVQLLHDFSLKLENCINIFSMIQMKNIPLLFLPTLHLILQLLD